MNQTYSAKTRKKGGKTIFYRHKYDEERGTIPKAKGGRGELNDIYIYIYSNLRKAQTVNNIFRDNSRYDT